MLSRKIAGLTATLALAVAASPMVPGAAAETKWGHLGIGAQGHTTEGVGVCGDYMDLYNAAISAMHDSISAGDYGQAFKDLDQAAQDRGAAHDAGCGWAWT